MKYLLLVIMLLAAYKNYAQNSEIIGLWKGEDNSKVIEIFKDTNGFFSGKDKETGNIILKNLEYDFEEQKYIGKMRPPDSDIELDVSLILSGRNKIEMKLKKFLFSKTITLIREK